MNRKRALPYELPDGSVLSTDWNSGFVPDLVQSQIRIVQLRK